MKVQQLCIAIVYHKTEQTFGKTYVVDTLNTILPLKNIFANRISICDHIEMNFTHFNIKQINRHHPFAYVNRRMMTITQLSR